jgi:hypothetical protein
MVSKTDGGGVVVLWALLVSMFSLLVDDGK